MKLRYTHPFIGNEQTVAVLQKLVKNGKIQQSNIIVGPDFVGKTTLVQNLILESFDHQHNWNTGKLPRSNSDIQLLRKGNHPNVFWLDVEAKKTMIRLQQVQEVLQDMRQTSALPGYRHIVINNADRLSLGAANALLKLIEEPNSNVVFWLLTDAYDSIVATIRSRCAAWFLHPVDRDSIETDMQVGTAVAEWSAGSPGKINVAKKMFSRYAEQYKDWLHVVQLRTFAERTQYLEASSISIKSNADLREQIAILESVVHDLLIATVLGSPSALLRQATTEDATTISNSGVCISALQCIQESRIRMQANVQYQYNLNGLLLNI